MSLLRLVLFFFLVALPSLEAGLKVPKSEGEQVEEAIHALDVDSQFTTFVKLLKDSNVISGSFKSLPGLTLFAPLNDSFSQAQVEDFLAKLTKEQTVQLLEYHALPKYYSFGDFAQLYNKMIPTVASKDDKSTFLLSVTPDFSVNTTGGIVSHITAEAFDAYPVVIYVVNKVLIPSDIVLPSPAPVPVEALTVLKWSGFFNTFLQLLDRAKLTDELESLSGFTLFVPTDKAFSSLSSSVWHKLNNRKSLSKVIKYHVVPWYYPPWSLGFIKTPLDTLASSSGDYQLVVKYMGGLKVAIETGAVESYVIAVPFNKMPVVAYSMDKVLLLGKFTFGLET